MTLTCAKCRRSGFLLQLTLLNVMLPFKSWLRWSTQALLSKSKPAIPLPKFGKRCARLQSSASTLILRYKPTVLAALAFEFPLNKLPVRLFKPMTIFCSGSASRVLYGLLAMGLVLLLLEGLHWQCTIQGRLQLYNSAHFLGHHYTCNSRAGAYHRLSWLSNAMPVGLHLV